MQLPKAVPEGTSVTWELHVDQPLHSAQMVFGGDNPHTLVMVPQTDDPRLVKLEVKDVGNLVPLPDRVANATVSYHLEWTGEGAWVQLRRSDSLRPGSGSDRPPLALLLKPHPAGLDRPNLATPRLELKFQIDASDDYGLSKVDIVFWVNPGPQETSEPRRWTVHAFPARHADGKPIRSARLEPTWYVKNSYPDLKEGDVVKCAVEAFDNRTVFETLDNGKTVEVLRPNAKTSPPFYLQFLSDKECLNYAAARQTVGLDLTRVLATEESINSKKLKTIIQGRSRCNPLAV